MFYIFFFKYHTLQLSLKKMRKEKTKKEKWDREGSKQKSLCTICKKTNTLRTPAEHILKVDSQMVCANTHTLVNSSLFYCFFNQHLLQWKEETPWPEAVFCPHSATEPEYFCFTSSVVNTLTLTVHNFTHTLLQRDLLIFPQASSPWMRHHKQTTDVASQ